LNDDIFKFLNAKIISHYTTPKDDSMWLGHRLFAVDGTKVNLLRQLSEIGYELPHGNAHYPFVLVSCLHELRPKIPIDFDLKVATGERTQALSHLTKLTKGNLSFTNEATSRTPYCIATLRKQSIPYLECRYKSIL
jgi:hypothetical protein